MEIPLLDMNHEEAKERIEKLKKEINHHRYLYHVLDKPDISDAIFDSLKNELEELEYKFPDLITPDSPSQRVGGEPLKEFKKINHLTPMVSFNDAFSEQEMREWEERYFNFLNNKLENTDFQYYCELKIDGLAIELEYENGSFKTGSTRGNGKIGEDATQNLKTIQTIPLHLPEKNEIIKNLKNLGLTEIAKKLEKNFPKKIVIRGEVFLNKKDFERLNKEREKSGEKIYANPRNVAAGSIRQLDPKITAKRKLDFFAYALVTNFGQTTHEQEHLILKSLGLKINPHNEPAKDLSGIFNFHKKTDALRESLPYEIDGIVVILNSEADFKKAGIVGKAPRAAIAYKFSAREATTKILDIQIQIGRTGALTPVAIMEPVGIGGITVSRATLHNYDEIQRLGVKIGDTVSISRAGDVIPQVNEVFKNLRTGKEKEFKMPNHCPICDSLIKKDENGVIYRCLNKNCFARFKENLYHFVSKTAFDIKGVGPKVIDRLLDENLIHDASDLFVLKEGDLAVLERFGEKSASNIINSINEKKLIELHRFIYALGIIHIGEETAVLLAQKINNNQSAITKPTEILNIIEKISIEKLQEIPDVGPKVAKSIYYWFKEEKNKKFIKELEENGIIFKKAEKGAASKKLEGLTFVLTGGLETMSRDEAKEKIRDLGGKISSDVSKETDYVIAGSDPGSKYERAKQLNVKIINEQKFKKMLED